MHADKVSATPTNQNNSTSEHSSEASETVSTPGLPTFNKIFQDKRLLPVQRQALVQNMAKKYGNRQIQRMLAVSKANAGQLQREGAAPTAGQEEPKELSGTITPTQVDGQPESWCNDDSSPQSLLPSITRSTPQLFNIINRAAEKERPLELRVNLSVKPDIKPIQGRSHLLGRDEATINSNFNIKTDTKVAGSVQATGEELFGYASGRVFIDGDWKLSDNILTVNATMNVTAYWAIDGLGRTNISSANSDEVNANSWSGVLYDLDLDGVGKPYRRKQYYVHAFTKAHELFHVSDIFKEATTYMPTAQAWLNKQTINVPSWSLFGPSKESMITFNLNTVLMELSNKVEDDIKAYMKSGGEERAYAAGRSSYEGLFAAIKERAKNEKWPLPMSPEFRQFLGVTAKQKTL